MPNASCERRELDTQSIHQDLDEPGDNFERSAHVYAMVQRMYIEICSMCNVYLAQAFSGLPKTTSTCKPCELSMVNQRYLESGIFRWSLYINRRLALAVGYLLRVGQFQSGVTVPMLIQSNLCPGSLDDSRWSRW